MTLTKTPEVEALDLGLIQLPQVDRIMAELVRLRQADKIPDRILFLSYTPCLAVGARKLNEADLLRAYPTLRAEDLANAWAYHRTHRDEIEQQIRANEEA